MLFSVTIALALTPAELDSALQEEMAKQSIPGLSIAVGQDGEVHYSKALGVADRDSGAAMSTQTAVPLGSIGKTATSTVIAQLESEGVLSLSDTLGTHLPEVGETYAAVTLQQVLQHQGGLPRDFKKGHSFTGKKLYKRLRKSTPDFAPGEGWAYSNTGYILLGELIERKTGLPLAEAFRTRVVDPAGMKDTVVIAPGDDPERAKGYYEKTGPAARFLPIRFGAGNLVSTASDLVRYDAALSDGSLVAVDRQEQYWAPEGREIKATVGDGKAYTIGLGWWVSEFRGHRSVGHSGSLDGYFGEFERYPDDGLVLVVLANAEYANLAPILQLLRETFVSDSE